MGRSYSFEPMKAQQPMVSAQGSGARLGNDEDQQALAQDAPALPTTPAGVPVYRQANAETVQRYQDRKAMREVEKEERRNARAKPRRSTAKKAAKKKPAAKARPSAAKKTAGAAKKASTSKKAKGARSAGKAKVSRSSAKTRKPAATKRKTGATKKRR